MKEERKYWNPEIETMPLNKLKKLQNERLQELVGYAYERSPLYRRKFDEVGVKPGDINRVEDLPKLPLTDDVKDIRGVPLLQKIAIPEGEIRMFHSTTGTTTGIAEPVPYSKKDVEAFFEGEARGRWTMGVRPWDVVQVLTGFDCCHRGYITMGATILLLSAGRYDMDKQIRLTESAGVTVLEHMPSLVLKYFERAKELGIDIKKTRLRMVSGVGEGWAESYKRKVELQYGLPFMTLWGSVELSVASAECEARKGMHIFSDLIILEVLDPETGKVLPPGEEGELIVTPLMIREAMPLIRYRVGDVAKLLPYEPCPCGRTHPKISMVKGRTAYYINIKGKKILPIDVEEVIASLEGMGGNYQIILDKPKELEKLKVRAEYTPETKDLRALKNRAEETFYHNLGIEAEVELVPKGGISWTTFKAQRVIKAY